MTVRYRILFFTSTLLLFALPSISSAADITGRLADRIAADGPAALQRVLLFVDSTGIADRPIHLSDAARTRRRRIDPTGDAINFDDYPVNEATIAAVRQTGVEIHGASRWLKAIIVSADPAQIDRLAALPSIRQIDLDRTLRAPFPEESAPPERLAGQSKAAEFNYGFSFDQNRFLNVIKLHNAGLTGRGVRIAVLDSGFDTPHRAFDSANIISTWDFVNGDATVDEPDCPTDIYSRQQYYHGTLVLGLLAGFRPDTLIGTAPEADYYLAKTEITCFGTEIQIEETNWILAAEWADSVGADIITTSLGYNTFTDVPDGYTVADLNGHTARITLAAEMAASKNILVVCSAGNDRGNSWGHIDFPADGDSVIAVGAVRFDSTLAPFSSPGPTSDGRIKPDITTIGAGIFTAAPVGSGWAVSSGTSFSAPQVAGCAALALEHDTTLTAADLRALIRGSGDRTLNPDNDFGYGLFDAVKTADIIRIIAPSRVTIAVDQSLSVPITTEGRSLVTPTLAPLNLPAVEPVCRSRRRHRHARIDRRQLGAPSNFRRA